MLPTSALMLLLRSITRFPSWAPLLTWRPTTEKEVDPRMDAILSIDTTKGNKVININGFAISPTIKSGYILEVSDSLLDVMTRVTGKLPAVFPVSQQDITPYGNDLHHLNRHSPASYRYGCTGCRCCNYNRTAGSRNAQPEPAIQQMWRPQPALQLR